MTTTCLRLLLAATVLLFLARPSAAGDDPGSAAAPALAANPNASLAAAGGRVIILGYDGADGATVEAMMQRGELPNLAKLRDQGSFARLGTTAPVESPTSWASLNTGQNPAKTNVPGFVRRELENPGIMAGLPVPTFGHMTDQGAQYAKNSVTLEQLSERFDFQMLPGGLERFSAVALASLSFALVFFAFFLTFRLLLRLRLAAALGLALALGAVGGWAGWTMRSYVPNKVPRWTNPNRAENFWDTAARAGVESLVLEAAQAFDQPSVTGARVLAGLGTPDARGGIGDWFIYTSAELYSDGKTRLELAPKGKGTGTAGTVYRIDFEDASKGTRRASTSLYGPKNFWQREILQQEIEALDKQLTDPALGYKESMELRDAKGLLETQDKALQSGIPIPLEVEIRGDSAQIRLGTETQTLKQGEWSDYYSLKFELNPLLAIHAVTRVKLISLNEPFRMFVNTIDIDPRKPPFWQPVSAPKDFSVELAARTGAAFETYGWACATMPFKDRQVEPELLLEDIEFTMKWRERLTYDSLARDDWRVLMSVLSEADRVQHMCYQFADPENPLYDEQIANRELTFFGERIQLRQAISAIYKQIDRMVGKVITEFMKPGDTLLVCSDHGFQSFHRQVHINNWLVEKGYMKLKQGLAANQGSSLTSYVDWSGTQAYALGLGYIFLNLKGREKNGIVEPAQADAVLSAIERDLLATRDLERGAALACAEVYRTSAIHSGPYLDKESDLIVGFSPTWRVSWSTSAGGISLVTAEDGTVGIGPVFVDNTNNWSGDHTSTQLSAVRGMFFSSRKVELPPAGVNLLDIAPTVLSLVGVAVPASMDNRPLVVR